MNELPIENTSVQRFATLLAEGPCPRPVYDEILLETQGCVVSPTLGSILPNWLLVIPRVPAINFARFCATDGVQPSQLIGSVLNTWGICQDRAIWFEHGASESGSALGCGVDQAHLHLIIDAPFTFDLFAAEAAKASGLVWEHRAAVAAHQAVRPWASYLVAAAADQAILAQDVESVGSQFFRRIVAKLAGQTEAWNYRTYPHLENVRETIKNLAGRAW